MRAVVFDQFGAVPVVVDVRAPSPPPGGVVLRVEATGLCRSDWHGWRDHDPGIGLPHVPGHELRARSPRSGRECVAGRRATG